MRRTSGIHTYVPHEVSLQGIGTLSDDRGKRLAVEQHQILFILFNFPAPVKRRTKTDASWLVGFTVAFFLSERNSKTWEPRMIIYVFAIVFTDVSTEYVSNFEISATETAFLRLRFSDLERSMRTLFQSISNGLTWGEVADNMYRLSWIWGYLYLIYVPGIFWKKVSWGWP